jgi:lipoprotein-anchoring transpeptidase ErfK/SrfK
VAHSAQNTNKAVWLDTVLLTGITVAAAFACALLTWMAWQAPGIVTARQNRTMAPTVVPTSTTSAPVIAPPPTHTATHTPLAATLPPPTPTNTPTPSPTLPPTPTPTRQPTAAAPAKKIVIDLSEQTLTAFEDAIPVFSALISAGTSRTPTPIGEFAIYNKIRSQTMTGPGYTLPNVQFVAYFTRSYAIHGTYWHDNFGHPMSHGCVNMRDIDAKWLFAWAPIGTPVSVRR